jgi:hypothetical protein
VTTTSCVDALRLVKGFPQCDPINPTWGRGGGLPPPFDSGDHLVFHEDTPVIARGDTLSLRGVPLR